MCTSLFLHSNLILYYVNISWTFVIGKFYQLITNFSKVLNKNHFKRGNWKDRLYGTPLINALSPGFLFSKSPCLYCFFVGFLTIVLIPTLFSLLNFPQWLKFRFRHCIIYPYPSPPANNTQFISGLGCITSHFSDNLQLSTFACQDYSCWDFFVPEKSVCGIVIIKSDSATSNIDIS